MTNNVAMKLALMVGIAMLMTTQFSRSSAQLTLPGDCWKDIATCGNGVETDQEFKDDCCPILKEQVRDATMCICSAQPILEMDPAAADVVSQLLSMCNIDSFEDICSGSAPSPSGTKSAPAPVPSLPCWDDVESCIKDNQGKIESMPQFNVSSPQFNETEFLCCHHVQEIAETAKPCFCGITTVMELQPSMTPNIMQIVARCNVSTSVLDLKDYCEGVLPPSHAPGPMTQGPTVALGPSADGKKSANSQEGAANKNMMAGSVSSLLVLLTYLLIN